MSVSRFHLEMEVDIKGICIEKLGKNRGKNGLTLHCFQLNVIQDVYFW
jgi:hypothetical protein